MFCVDTQRRWWWWRAGRRFDALLERPLAALAGDAGRTWRRPDLDVLLLRPRDGIARHESLTDQAENTTVLGTGQALSGFETCIDKPIIHGQRGKRKGLQLKIRVFRWVAHARALSSNDRNSTVSQPRKKPPTFDWWGACGQVSGSAPRLTVL